MNPILALFWKEGREAAYKVVACAGLAMIVGLLYNLWEYPQRTILGADVGIVGHFVGLIGAVLMGMDAIARERTRTTLPFLLCRPLETGTMLSVKFVMGAAGLLAILAAYWGGIFVGMSLDGSWIFGEGGPNTTVFSITSSIPAEDTLADVGYVRILLLWFLVFLIPYSAAVLVSTLTDHPFKAAVMCLLAAWVATVFIGIAWNWGPPIVAFYFRLLFSIGVDRHAGILRKAFDVPLLLTRGAASILVAGAILVLSFRALRQQVGKRFQWTVGGLAAICAIAVIGMDVYWSRYGRRPEPPVQPISSLLYRMDVADLALRDGMAVVLLDRGLSLVDVSDPQAPSEIGRVEKPGWRFQRLALSATRAYVWGEYRDSVGVAVFNFSRPDRPLVQAVNLLQPVEEGPTPWLQRVPRLVGWGVWDSRLYVGLLNNDFLKLHSFDVREKGLPPYIHAFPIAETHKHVWNNEWVMRIAGPRLFMTVGHDFVVLDLDDPSGPKVLSRTPLRRFGRSVDYEKLVVEVLEGLASGSIMERIKKRLEETRRRVGPAYWRFFESRGLQSYMIAAPPGLGPLTVTKNRVYIERHLPREIAIMDISDPREPIEVDYLPWTRLPTMMIIDGESAYALRGNAVQTYARTIYGAYKRKERLGLDNPLTYRPGAGVWGSNTQQTARARDMFIPQGDHIYALLNNHLAIFENPRKVE